MRLMPSTSRIASGLAQARFHNASVEALYDELRAVESDRATAIAPPDQYRATLPFRQSLTLQHVSYTYPEKPQPAVDDILIEIPRGHWVGFVGPTGAGKTTLIDLILGLLVPTSGSILIDGSNLRQNVSGWQRKIGYVPQDIYLIDDTVRRNVAFGVPDAEIDDARVWKALHAAQLEATVRAMPGELDAATGQRGDRLSGGERQRLGIARALYGDPEVLVVDEATANLDHETEAAVVDTLARLRGGKTIIVIAHRFSVVKDCDCVFVMKDGRVQNSGALSHLFSTDPAFREFAGTVF
jgi:ATP-binding cassette subfamily C protein